MDFEFIVIDYLVTSKLRLSNELIKYHNNYCKYLNKSVGKPKYISPNIRKPENDKQYHIFKYFEDTAYNLLELSVYGVKYLVKVITDNNYNIDHVMFRFDESTFVIISIRNKEVIDIRKFNLS